MRILTFGDGAWATSSIEALAREGWTLVGIVARVNPSDVELLKTGEKLGLPVLQPTNVNTPDSLAQLTALKPDLGVCISYDQILKPPVMAVTPKGVVNFHAGKLPHYRGRNIINWAIINGEEEIGLTVHYIDEGIDTGDIILQRTASIGWTDTYGDVLDRVAAALPGFVVDTVQFIDSGEAPRRPQAHLPGTYFSRRRDGDEWLDWSDTSRNLHNKVRAISHPAPGARTALGDETVIIWEAFYDPTWPQYIATMGEVVGQYSGAGVMVKTSDSTLLVKRVQVGEGEEHVPSWRIGTRLGMDLRAHLKRLERRLDALEGPQKVTPAQVERIERHCFGRGEGDSSAAGNRSGPEASAAHRRSADPVYSAVLVRNSRDHRCGDRDGARRPT